MSSLACQPQANQLAGPQPSDTVHDTTGSPDLRQEPVQHNTTCRVKALNLNTYKHHALGDYTAAIQRYGTTDSYSTELVSILFRYGLSPK
jgi:hypothetical protein